MPSRSGRTEHSLLTCDPCSHRRPDLPVRKTDLAGRGALSTCRRGVAMCGTVSFTFRSPRVTAPISQGVLRNDRLRPRVCWHSSEVYHGCGQIDHGGEALIGLVGAHGDAFELLELAEEVFDEM